MIFYVVSNCEGIIKFYKLWPEIYYYDLQAMMDIFTMSCDSLRCLRPWRVLPSSTSYDQRFIILVTMRWWVFPLYLVITLCLSDCERYYLVYIYISLCCCVSLTLVSHSQLPLSPQWHNHRKNDTKDLGAKTSPTNRMNIGKMFQKKFPFSSFVWAPLNHREDLEQMTTKRMTEGIFVLRSLLLTPQIIFGIQLTYFHGKKYEVNLYALERL
jgi:hypothetical protein